MDSWTRIMGFVLLLFAAYTVRRGRVAVGDETSTTYIERSEKPVQFWISVIIMLVAAALLIFNVFNF